MNEESTLQSSNEVLVIGVGLTKVGEHWETSLRELAFKAIRAARADAGGIQPQALYFANMLGSILSGQTQLAALVADFAGLHGIEAATMEAAGASGGVALRQAYLAITSGAIDIAAVIGAEKFSEKLSSEVDAALATTTDADFEAIHGVTPTSQAAMLMRRYLYENGAPSDALAGFSITSHANAVANPNAMYRRAISLERYQKASMISEPLNLYDVSPNADGAAALILARSDVLPNSLTAPKVRIIASAASTSPVALHDRQDPLIFDAAAESSHRAYEQAGIDLKAINCFELHDQFSIYAALSLEAAGFAKKGQGWRLSQDGEIGRDGRIPICTFGGSKARGDAGGATGLYQAAEIVLQLQERAEENQIPNARIGMAQCLGNAGSIATTHIFARD